MRVLLLLAWLLFTLPNWGFAHRGGSPALVDAPVGPYTLTYFGDLHIGTAEATLLLSGENLADAALTLHLTSPSGDAYEVEAERVRETPGSHVFVARAQIDEAGDWRARVTVADPSGAASREVAVSTSGRFAGFWREAVPYLSLAVSLVGAFAAVWHFATPTQVLQPLEDSVMKIRYTARRAYQVALLPILLMVLLAAAQEDQSATGRGLYIEVPSQERLLHRKPTGDYTLTVLGERLIGNAYFVFDVTHPEGEVGAGSRVAATLRLLPYNPYEMNEVAPEEVTTTYLDEETSDIALELEADPADPPLSETEDDSTRYEARFDAEQGRFVIDEIELQEGFYTVDVQVEGPLGQGESSFILDVYPLKPEASWGFRLANLVAPPLVLIGLLLAARRAGWRLERPSRGAVRKGFINIIPDKA